ncbi:hypothetical protein F383_02855 [Gossypium arboreum]|uniref:Uncharacterized protein n=1 Tax=Gossypium arboreum TaxID=29729 RepID=A0A0B0NYQ3_GOSAR|nr:hypothetical protein F383_02855 [Gossypium arboreum]
MYEMCICGKAEWLM